KWTDHDGSFTLGWYLDLPDPSTSSDEYKAKVLRMKNPRAVVRLGEWSDEDETHWDVRPPFDEYQLPLLIDARYDTDRIVSELKEILKNHKPKNRHQTRLYKWYLAVWDLRKDGLTDTAIAQRIWPDEYAAIGGRDSGTGDKGALIQRVYDYESAAQRLIDNSFPLKKR